MGSKLTSAAMHFGIQAKVDPNISGLSGTTTVADNTDVIPTIGSGVGAADDPFIAVGNVSAGTPVVIDFTTLKNPFGNTITSGHVVGLKVTNTSTNISGGTITHGGGTNPLYAAAPLVITPGDAFQQSFNGAGLPITGGSAQNLQLLCSTGTVGYRVTALVRSA